MDANDLAGRLAVQRLTARLTRRFALLAVLVLVGGAAVAPALDAVEPDADGKITLRLIRVWASTKSEPAPFPAGLKKYRAALEKGTKKKGLNNFSLRSRPEEKTVSAEETASFALPENYQLALTPVKEKGKWILRYRLTRKDSKFKSELRLKASKKKPRVILSPIQKKDEQLVLILVSEQAK